jgi:hypothetical protein
MRSRRGRSRALAALGAWSDDVGLVQQSSSHAVTQSRSRHAVGQSSSKQGTTAGSWQRALARRLLSQVRRDGGPWRAPQDGESETRRGGRRRPEIEMAGALYQLARRTTSSPWPKAGPLPTWLLPNKHTSRPTDEPTWTLTWTWTWTWTCVCLPASSWFLAASSQLLVSS